MAPVLQISSDVSRLLKVYGIDVIHGHAENEKMVVAGLAGP